jgi:hypothetical protein
MELSPSWEAVNCAVTQEIPSILWNPKVHYRVHKSPPLVLILSQINPIHTIPSYLSKINFNIVHHLRLGLPSGLFPSGFPTNILCKFLFNAAHAKCPVHIILLHLIIVIILGEKLLMMQFSPSLLPLHLSSVQILSALSSQTPSIYVPPLMSESKFYTHYSFVYLIFTFLDSRREGKWFWTER